MNSELLTPDELADLTGCKQRAAQKAWLDEHHWHYVTSRADEPKVGRYYARLKLAGQSPANTVWSPDFSKVG